MDFIDHALNNMENENPVSETQINLVNLCNNVITSYNHVLGIMKAAELLDIQTLDNLILYLNDIKEKRLKEYKDTL